MNITLTKMTLKDLEEIKNILSSNFDDYWNQNILKEELLNSSSYYFVAKNENKIVGFAGFKVIVDEADIMNIVVNKSYRHKGIGSLLLENIIFLSKKMKLKYLNLEVNTKNTFAINLYDKFGFKKLGERKNYYKNDNAIIMKKEL